MIKKFLRFLIIKLRPRGRRGYLKTNWKVYCTWGESSDVTLMFDDSCHLMFEMTSDDAISMAKELELKANEAKELEKAADDYFENETNKYKKEIMEE